MEAKKCSICLISIMKKDIYITQCIHYFHVNCISEWYDRSKTCPECRMIISEQPRVKSTHCNDESNNDESNEKKTFTSRRLAQMCREWYS